MNKCPAHSNTTSVVPHLDPLDSAKHSKIFPCVSRLSECEGRRTTGWILDFGGWSVVLFVEARLLQVYGSVFRGLHVLVRLSDGRLKPRLTVLEHYRLVPFLLKKTVISVARFIIKIDGTDSTQIVIYNKCLGRGMLLTCATEGQRDMFSTSSSNTIDLFLST